MYRSSERLRHLITLRLVTRTLIPGRPSAFRDFRWPVAIWPSSPPATQEILGFACLVGFTGFAQDENASIDLVVRGSLLPPTLHAARTNPWVYRIIWDSHVLPCCTFQVDAPAYSTLVATPKMARRPTHPLMPPRLLPIRNRSPCRALTRCRYSRPRHRTRTMSPTAGSLSPRGTTVTLVAIVDLAGHGMPTRSHDDCLASRELLYRGAGPTHGC